MKFHILRGKALSIPASVVVGSWHFDCLITDMTRDTKRGGVPTPPTLHRILRRDTRAITCQLDARSNRSYELCVVPHWDPSSAVIEQFDAPTPALLRHAEVARRLRENGWMVIDHVDAGSVHGAA
jgi:hypothetical protein